MSVVVTEGGAVLSFLLNNGTMTFISSFMLV